MRRSSKNTSHRLSAESQRLMVLAQGLVQSGSRLEARAWETALDAQIHKLLKSHHQAGIDHALDRLFTSEPEGYDALMEAVEAGSESVAIEHEGVRYDALLIAVPILAWTRFSIASGPIATELVQTLSTHLQAHLLAPKAQVAMAPMLYSIDQLPRTPSDTFALTHRLAQAALKNDAVKITPHDLDTAPFLADIRYLLAVTVVPAGTELFCWQTTQNLQHRAQALEQWQAQATPTIVRLLPGCGIDLLLPQAYYLACREADRSIRPASIRAAVHFLTNTLEIDATMLQAVIGAFGEEDAQERTEEYRVSFMLADDTDVLYGVVWPLYGAEDAEEALRGVLQESLQGSLHDSLQNSRAMIVANNAEEAIAPIDEILGLLREAGVTKVHQHEERFLLEFCDDCGAPLYPDLDAELVHAEMPEDAPQAVSHFH